MSNPAFFAKFAAGMGTQASMVWARRKGMFPRNRLSFARIFLMLTFVGLTFSMPLLEYSKRGVEAEIAESSKTPVSESEGETENPSSKSEKKTSGTEDYLHDIQSSEQYMAFLSRDYKADNVAACHTYFGELLSPPPDFPKIFHSSQI